MTSFDDIPGALRKIETRPLFVMRLDVRATLAVGGPPGAGRRIGLVTGGIFEGDRLSGTVLDSGNDWQTMRADGVTALDVRVVLRTNDNALIAMTYRGLRHGPAEIIARMEKGEPVDPSDYYFRIAPLFETAQAKYDWLNRIVAVGTGYREAKGPIYSIFEVL